MPEISVLAIILPLAVALVACLYAAVGHGGASGYLAILTLAGLTLAEIKPTALLLNILVAGLGAWRFWQAGHFSGKLLWPLVLGSIPAAYIGGAWDIPSHYYRPLLGIVLLYSAWRLLASKPTLTDQKTSIPSFYRTVLVGSGIGLLAGITGTGGGIFLTPLLLFCHWAAPRPAAALSACFILLNSTAALLGYSRNHEMLPNLHNLLVLAVAAAIGGSLGSHLGSRQLPEKAITRLLAVVLILAGGKLFL